MGFIRGSLVFLLGFLLLISLIMGNVFLTLNLSINTENLQKGITKGIIEVTEYEGEAKVALDDEEVFSLLEEHCENNSNFQFTQYGYNINIPCSTIEEGPDAVLQKGINSIIEESYNKEYSCNSFFSCIKDKNNYGWFVSEDGKNYWQNKFMLFLGISLFLIFIMYFLTEGISGFFITTGILVSLASLPFTKIDNFLDFAISFISSAPSLQLISILFSESNTVFIINFTLGIILIGIGISIKFFNLGSFIAEKLMKNRFKKN